MLLLGCRFSSVFSLEAFVSYLDLPLAFSKYSSIMFLVLLTLDSDSTSLYSQSLSSVLSGVIESYLNIFLSDLRISFFILLIFCFFTLIHSLANLDALGSFFSLEHSSLLDLLGKGMSRQDFELLKSLETGGDPDFPPLVSSSNLGFSSSLFFKSSNLIIFITVCSSYSIWNQIGSV